MAGALGYHRGASMRVELTPPSVFLRYLRLFYRRAGHRLLWLVGLITLASSLEAFGIVLFFPLFTAGGASAPPPAIMLELFRVLGLRPTPRAVLPIIVAVFVFKGLLQFLSVAYQHFLSAELARTARTRLVSAFCSAAYRHVIHVTSGFYTNLVTSEVTRSGQAFIAFTHTLPPVINIAVFISIVFVLDWRLMLAAVGMGLLAVVCFRLPGRLTRQYSEMASQEHGSLAALLVQSVQAFKYLRATASFPRFQPRIDDSVRRLAHLEIRTGVAVALLLALLQPLLVVFIAAILFFRLADGAAEIAPLFLALIYLFRIMNEIFVLQTSWQAFCTTSGGVDLIERSLEQFDQRLEPSGARPFTGLRDSLRCAGVRFGYADQLTLDDVSLSIPKNTSVAFVGESGAGKSTLADILIGVLRPASGIVTVDGIDLTELVLDDYRRRIGYIPQEPAIFDDTIEHNVTLWAHAAPEDVRQAARRAHALGFIEAAPHGLQTRVGERGIQLSGGQRQRLAIARELFRRPEILVLDEATSALDSESERAIQESIDELKGQMTLLIIAHRLSTIRNCDHIYVLDAGRIVEHGSYGGLLATPGARFRTMCELQGLVLVGK